MKPVEADGQQADIPVENIDTARRLYRQMVAWFFAVGLTGFFAGGYLVLSPLSEYYYIGGIGQGEWVLVFTLSAVILLIWSQAYKISRLLNNSTLFYMVVLMPFLIVMLQVAIAQAARRAGYRLGPFAGSLRQLK